MKKKQKVDSVIGVVMIIMGVLYLLFPLYHINNLKVINIIMFTIIAVVSFGQFIINKKSKDYTGLYNTIAALGFILMMCILDVSKPEKLSLAILIWVALESVIKLKKSDYYNDRRDKMWKISLIMLVIFIISGILTSINLRYEEEVRVIVMGFFILIDGILELMDPVVKSLIQRS